MFTAWLFERVKNVLTVREFSAQRDAIAQHDRNRAYLFSGGVAGTINVYRGGREKAVAELSKRFQTALVR